ncbi:MAG: hypothetical protein HW421_449 [Ignavibacteria bacterium]|nr:hypothetical protein [Ignavibacteria bacterium]
MINQAETINKDTSFNIQKLGLCATCNSIEQCVSINMRTMPVWYCNEFDNFVKRNGFQQPVNEAPGYLKLASTPDNHFKGICSSCERRLDCNYVSVGEGVWHCSDYE